jgi:hypothetical protein
MAWSPIVAACLSPLASRAGLGIDQPEHGASLPGQADATPPLSRPTILPFRGRGGAVSARLDGSGPTTIPPHGRQPVRHRFWTARAHASVSSTGTAKRWRAGGPGQPPAGGRSQHKPRDSRSSRLRALVFVGASFEGLGSMRHGSPGSRGVRGGVRSPGSESHASPGSGETKNWRQKVTLASSDGRVRETTQAASGRIHGTMASCMSGGCGPAPDPAWQQPPAVFLPERGVSVTANAHSQDNLLARAYSLLFCRKEAW